MVTFAVDPTPPLDSMASHIDATALSSPLTFAFVVKLAAVHCIKPFKAKTQPDVRPHRYLT